MKNVKVRIEGNRLILEVDLEARLGPSTSGKTTIIASTEGNSKLPPPHGEISFGLNVYTTGKGK